MKKTDILKWISKILSALELMGLFFVWIILTIGIFLTSVTISQNLSRIQIAYAGQKFQGIPIEFIVTALYIVTAAAFIFTFCGFPTIIIKGILSSWRSERYVTDEFLNMTLAVKIQEEFNERYPNYKGYLKANILRTSSKDRFTQYAIELNLKDAVIFKDTIVFSGEKSLEDRSTNFCSKLSETFNEMIERFEFTYTTEEAQHTQMRKDRFILL